MRRKREPLMKRTVSGSLAALMTAISVLSTSGAVPAYASEAKVKLSYQQENMEKIGLYVQAENESFAPGEEVNLTIYIQNNSNQPLTEGTLKWVDKKETLQNAAFVYETEDGEAEEKATPDSAQEETTEAEEVEESEDLGTPEASEELGTPEGAEAPEETKAAGPASDFGQDDGNTVEEDWFGNEDEGGADDAEQSGPYLDEDGYVRNISLAPGEIFQIPFTAVVNEDIFGIRTRDIRFTFGARTPNNKRLSNYVKYQFNTGLMTLQPIELVGGNQVETNEENTMIFRLDMDDIEYMFEDNKNVSKATDSNAMASASEAEAEFTPAEVIDSDTAKATPSEAEQAVSEAEKETPEAAVSEAGKATASEAKQEEAEEENAEKQAEKATASETTEENDSEEEDSEEENEGVFRPEEVKYSIETYGVRLKGVKARFDEEASGPAESVTEVSYRVASDTKPGFYFGKVTASVRYNGNTYKTEQGFVMNVTGEGQMVLRGKLGDAEIEVRGPAESFPDGEILSLRVTELSEEQKEMVQQAMEKMAQEKGIAVERMKAMDIKVITDGTPQEINGPVEVTFVNVNLEDINKTEEKEDTLKEKLAELFSEEEEKKTELENAEVWHLNEDEITLDKMDSTVDEDGNVVMKTNHFSPYLLTEARTLYTAAAREDDLKVVTKAESGITFKLFDYSKWINVKVDKETFRPITPYFNFRNSGSDAPLYDCNQTYDQDGFTENHATVERILKENGGVKYPVLDLKRNAKGKQRNDPNLPADNLKEEDRSLDYLFGAKTDFAVDSYEPENTILVQDGNKYSYNSQKNAVDYDRDEHLFRVRSYSERNDSTAGYEKDFGDFLPFNYTGGVPIGGQGTNHEYHVAASDPNVPTNYWFGMTMEVPFFQTKDGKIANGNDTTEDMVFRFSGDDDVWVFIDDVLVLDLGGTHGTVDGSINFATGEVLQYLTWGGVNSTEDDQKKGSNTSFPTTIKACFDAAGKKPNGGWADNGKIFAEYTKHTLKFFYMERGAAVANCKMEFNLPTLPDKSLTVTKELQSSDGQEHAEIKDYLSENMNYQFKVLKAGSDGKATSELFIKEGTPYKILKDGNETGAGTVGKEGIFTLKAGQSAQFEKMLDMGEGNSYVVREIMPKVLSGQYRDVQYTVDSTTGTITTDGSSREFITYDTQSLAADQTQVVTYNNVVDITKLQKIKVTKVWEDGDNLCGNRPDTVTFRLYADGVAFPGSGGVLTLSGDEQSNKNTWVGEFKNLPKLNTTNNQEITYTVKEMNGETAIESGGTLPGKNGVVYTVDYGSGAAESGYIAHVKITNTHRHKLTVTKHWSDGNENHAQEEVWVGLYKGSEPVADSAKKLIYDSETKALSVIYENQIPMAYTVKELAPTTDTTPDFEIKGKGYNGVENNGRYGDFYKVTYSPENGTVTSCDSTVAITNTLSKATIRVGKWIDNYSSKLTGDQFIVNVSVPDRGITAGPVLKHGETSGEIEVYTGNGPVEVKVSEIIPMEYTMTGFSLGTRDNAGTSVAGSNNDILHISIASGEEKVLWVHNSFAHKNFFHHNDEKMNDFDRTQNPDSQNASVNMAAVLSDRKEWELLEETQIM